MVGMREYSATRKWGSFIPSSHRRIKGENSGYEDRIALISFNCPDSWLVWIEKKRAEAGHRSRQSVILAALQAYAGVPRESDIERAEDSWPVSITRFVCPACQNGEHCGGGVQMMPGGQKPVTLEDAATKTRIQWNCVCQTCMLARSGAEVSPAGLAER
jgi:hypothetical protein